MGYDPFPDAIRATCRIRNRSRTRSIASALRWNVVPSRGRKSTLVTLDNLGRMFDHAAGSVDLLRVLPAGTTNAKGRAIGAEVMRSFDGVGADS